MNPSFVRHTHALTIFHAIRTNPGITQRELGELAGTDKSTTSDILKAFSETKLVEKAERPATNRPGRPSAGFQLSRDGSMLIGVHPRHSEITFVASGLDGQPISTIVLQRSNGAIDFLEDIRNGVRAITMAVGRRLSDVRGVGVSAPGMVSIGAAEHQENTLIGTNIGLKQLYEKGVGAPLFVDNDANGSALAESFFSGRQLPDDFLYIEGGTDGEQRGVGGAVFVDGSLYRGSFGYAGEIGHMKVERGGRPCLCGQHGCLASYVEEASILSRIETLLGRVHTLEEVADLSSIGNAEATTVLQEAGEYLGLALGNLIDFLNPQEVILGGSFTRVYDQLRPHLIKALERTALPPLLNRCQITSSTLNNGTPLGGIAIALDGCTSDSSAGIAPWEVAKS